MKLGAAGKHGVDFHQWRQILARKEKCDAELATGVNANVGNCRLLIVNVSDSANMRAELAVCQKSDRCERSSLIIWILQATRSCSVMNVALTEGQLIQRLCIISSQPRVCKSPPAEIPLQSWNTSPRLGLSRQMWQILKVATGPRLAQFRPGGYSFFFLFSVIILLA